MAFATVQDVEVRFHRPLTASERALVEARLEDAEDKIRAKLRDLPARLTADPDLIRVVVRVCVDAVIRLVRNPEGYVQETDGNYTYMLSQEYASSRLLITPDEWADLGLRRGFGVVHTLPKLPWEA